MKISYSYADISLVPRNLSTIKSRNDIDLSTTISVGNQDFVFRLPIMPAPMDTICSRDLCGVFHQNGMLGMIHRFQPLQKRQEDYQYLLDKNMQAIVALGLDEKDIAKEFFSRGARFFIIDVANGFNKVIEPMVKYLKALGSTFIICGNVDSMEGFMYLSSLGVDAIRAGIGTGSMCTTSIMTGVGQGSVSSLLESVKAKRESGAKTLVIADGGIQNAGDIAKALCLGADFVMIGRMFAGTKEAEGNILKYDGKLYKAYRGSASFAVQLKQEKKPYFVEGDETIVEYKGGIQKILGQIDAGLRSSLSYMAANNLTKFRENCSYVAHHSP